MSFAVVEGATLSCSEGSSPSSLIVTNSVATTVENKRLAVIDDHTPANVSHFGKCNKKNDLPCVLWEDLPIPWYPGGMRMEICGPKPVITSTSVLICTRGGVIRVDDPGTSSITIDYAADDPNNPNAIATDTLIYYLQRQSDFFYRHGGPPPYPPPYYVDYGNYYLNKFKDLNLSDAGREWVDNTRRALQEFMEDFRKKHPQEFAKLEMNPEAFRGFAYDTHPEAYARGGFCGLSERDWAKIVFVLRNDDKFDLSTVEQSVKTLWECAQRPGELVEKLEEDAKELVPDYLENLNPVYVPPMPGLQTDDNSFIPSFLDDIDLNPFD